MLLPIGKQGIEFFKLLGAVMGNTSVDQLVYQQVTYWLGFSVRAQQKMHPKTELSAQYSCGATMVGLDATRGNQRVATLGPCFSQ